MDKYSVTNIKVGNLMSAAETGDIAIPEIQRPFVWKRAKVRDLIDSLYNGYPIGYIITWKSPDVKIKDGKTSNGRLTIIDGQQRISALSTAMYGIEIVNSNYKKERIVISFNPTTEEFKVKDKGTERGKEWITDIAEAMEAGRKYVNDYLKTNGIEDSDFADVIDNRIDRLKSIKNADVGNITLDASLAIDVVTEIFIRINDAGVKLSQADFTMSKIAIYEKEPRDEYGMYIRKYIDYFCELATTPENITNIEENDIDFTKSSYWNLVKWVADDENEDYIPTYNDILRVVSLVEFNRGKLGDLVALLSGRDFEHKDYKHEIAVESFDKLEAGIKKYTKKSNFEHFVQDILWNLGVKNTDLSLPKNAVNYAYAMYLRGKELSVNDAKLKSLVRRLLVISLLSGRHSGSFESQWTQDFQKMVNISSLEELVTTLERQTLTDVFWDDTLPSRFDNSNINSSLWSLYTLAQNYLGNQSFLSSTLVRDMKTAQVHHIYPKKYLIKNGISNKNLYNQLSNYVYLHDQINNKIDDKAPKVYLGKVLEFAGSFGSELNNDTELRKNFKENCIPLLTCEGTKENYMDFLKERALLMSQKIKEYYSKL
ncbi:MAG: GmrSD restriction endonuclease domain-containing protein [Anaerovoracaceae bacterium]